MACTRELSITITEEPETEDMPLNSAVYESGRNKIYAVRSGRVFKFDADGVLENEARFLCPAMDDSYISYDITTDKLWAVMHRSFGAPSDASFPAKYLVSIDPDTLSATAYNFQTDVVFGAGNWQNTQDGPLKIICITGVAFILAYSFGGQNEIETLYRIDLTTSPPTEIDTIGNVNGGGWGSIVEESPLLWYCSNDNENSIDAVVTATGANHTDFVLLNGSTDRPYGLARVPGQAMYACQATPILLKGTPSAAPVLRTTIDLGRPNATPFHMHYASFNGKIYIPLFNDDTVAVLDPFDDSFVIKTGFDSPWDVVLTASKAFAIQHSAEGLKEIT